MHTKTRRKGRAVQPPPPLKKEVVFNLRKTKQRSFFFFRKGGVSCLTFLNPFFLLLLKSSTSRQAVRGGGVVFNPSCCALVLGARAAVGVAAPGWLEGERVVGVRCCLVPHGGGAALTYKEMCTHFLIVWWTPPKK